MKSLLIRTISAVVAIALIFSVYYFFELNGLRVLIILIIAIAASELSKILFGPNEISYRRPFAVSSFLLFLMMILPEDKYAMDLSFFCFTVTAYISFVFFKMRQNQDINSVLSIAFRHIAGLLYIGLFPSFAFRVLSHENGLSWFLLLLVIVFAGDICAYLFGVKFGKTKIFPHISPKKSLEGAIGGLFGSVLVAGLFGPLLLNIPTIFFIEIGIICSFVAQTGDFFESLLKRVAQVKDSGSIMPGHGGVLDRIDGVIFASPALYHFAVWLNGSYS